MTDRPQEPAETSELRELVASWRKDSAEAIRRGRKSDYDFFDGVQNTYDQCADELEERMKINSPKDPPMSLLVKLGSIAVHADEMLSSDGHVFDRVVTEQLIRDPEVVAWLAAMNKLALIPKKRKAGGK